jgi:type VI secretion system protein ImpH
MTLMLEAPERFDVFQLVRLLRLHGGKDAAAPAMLPRSLCQRLMSGLADGRRLPGRERRVWFRAELSPEFPGTEVTECRYAENAPADSDRPRAVEIRTPNYCVASELGPLPEPFLEWVRDRLRDGDSTFAAFLDLFNHRVNVLRHQLKASQDVVLDHAPPEDTLQADLLACLAGVASPDAEAQIVLPRRAWLGMTATLADPRRSAAAACIALRQYLGAPAAQLESLVGDWRPLAPSQWTRLGRPGATLGAAAVLGTQVWDEMAGVRLSVPEVDYGRLCALLPPPWSEQGSDDGDDGDDGDECRAPSKPERLDGYVGLAHMVRLLFDRRVDCTVELTVRATHLPQPVLTALPGTGDTAPSMSLVAAAEPPGVRYRGLLLGQTAWLAGGPAQAGDLRRVAFMIAGDPLGDAFQ